MWRLTRVVLLPVEYLQAPFMTRKQPSLSIVSLCVEEDVNGLWILAASRPARLVVVDLPCYVKANIYKQ